MTAGTFVAEPGLASRSWGGRSFLEFMITGGLTLALFPLAYLYRHAIGLDDAQYKISFAAFYAAYVINDPHFSVSYLLFYKNIKQRLWGDEFGGAQRVRYLVAGFLVPIALVAWITAAMVVKSAAILGAMVQLMYLLVGWHYVKQGFGVLSVLSARRGVRFSPLERRVLLTHCFAGWAYAWASPAEAGRDYEEAGVMYRAIAHPAGLELVTLVVFCASCAALLAVVGRRLWLRQAFPPWAASSGYLMSIWLWTIFSQVDPLMIYLIPALHSLQYWYFVYLLKRNEAHFQYRTEARPAEQAPFLRFAARRLGLLFVSAVGLAWLLFHGIPELLDSTIVATTAAMGLEPDVSPYGLGTTPYLAAFATFINIHHYFIDHVIWRRENPDTRFLQQI
ncbi:MAG TPA: hypothetical protein VN764_15645 [Polyangiaceae bacterium]|nr:hypothetical protein [Polyangiaceae bacterium]